MLFSMEISKIDQKNINNDENLPIFIQGGGVIFGIFIVFKLNKPPLLEKKRNPSYRKVPRNSEEP